MESIKVKYHNGYLQAFMPNGELIPAQTDIKIENGTNQKNMVTVTVSFEVPISNINNEEVNPFLQQKIDQLSLQKESLLKDCNFWEREHKLEHAKKWYHKLFKYNPQITHWPSYWPGYFQNTTK